MSSAKQPIITICASSSFYEKAVKLQDELSKHNFKALVPVMAEEMKRKNNYRRVDYQPWLKDESAYGVKAELIHGHFDKVAVADGILVLNGEKHGVANYIGGNVLMEMGLAFHLNIPIFIYYGIPEESKFMEEIKGMLPVVLNGKLTKLVNYFGRQN